MGSAPLMWQFTSMFDKNLIQCLYLLNTLYIADWSQNILEDQCNSSMVPDMFIHFHIMPENKLTGNHADVGCMRLQK